MLLEGITAMLKLAEKLANDSQLNIELPLMLLDLLVKTSDWLFCALD